MRTGFRISLRRTALAAVVLAALVAAWFVSGFGRIAAGYAATVTTIQHYGVGDSLERVRDERLGMPFGLQRLVEVERNEADDGIRARAFGLFEAEAIWRPGLGATRTNGASSLLPLSLEDLVPRPPEDEPWPLGSSPVLTSLEPDRRAALEAVIDGAFAGPDFGSHAVVVVQDGRLVAERYREGYDAFQPLLGWSMTKSVTCALVGQRILAGALPPVDSPAPLALWQEEGDPRREITLDQLLRMQSGLAFFADYELPWSDSLHMLFVEDDAAGFAAAKPLEFEPGTHWSYSDGTSNILARLVRDSAGEALEDQLLYPQRDFFGPLRMSTAFLGVDARGTFVGSSLMQASARDWARFGQLHLDDGVFDGQRLLPEGWVDYVTTPSEHAPHACYGAQFWRFDEEHLRDSRGNPVPDSLGGIFYASGHDDQYVWMDPARRLVVVRLGLRVPSFDPPRFLAQVIEALE